MIARIATLLVLWAMAGSAPAAVRAAVQPPAGDEQVDTMVSTGLSTAAFHAVDEQFCELLATALAENPGVESAWARSRSMFARVPQQRSLPDPQLSYRYFVSSPETRVGPQQHALELSQAVPWGGKRRLQAARAASSAAGQTWEAEQLERRLVAELKKIYFEAAYLQEALRVNEDERELLERFERIALKRYATGQGIQQSVVKVQTETSRLEDRRTALRERLDAVKRKLAERIGRPEVALELAPVRLPFPDLDLDAGEFAETAATGHPRVRAAEQRMAADRAWAERQRLAGKPDFRFGIGYTVVGERDDLAGVNNPPEDNGVDVAAVMVGINLPLYRQRVRAGVAEARQSVLASQDSLAAVRDQLRSEAQQALLEIDSLTFRGRLYQEVIIPQAEESLASSEAAYTTDRLSFLDLLDAERVLFQSRLAYHRLLADLWIALAELELAAALPVPQEAGAECGPMTTGDDRDE